MEWEAELALVERTARNLRLGFSVVVPDDELSGLDRGLRTLLELDLNGFPRGLWENLHARERVIYRVKDTFTCRYAIMLLPGGQTRVLVLGPYIDAPMKRQTLVRILSEWGDSALLLPHIEKYFTGIPVLYEDGAILAMLDALAEGFWGRDGYTVEWLEYSGRDRERPQLRGGEKAEAERVRFEERILEERYAAENQMMTAVSQGRFYDVERVLNYIILTRPETRTEDPLRDMKNYLIVFNTLLRKAAEEGGVHPLPIDLLSGGFARRIEEMEKVQEMSRLAREMAQQYCALVQKCSLRAYSLPVQRLITAIDQDLAADLRLSTQAERLGRNPSYLSSLFHRETGMTYTEYVNRRRAEQGAILLRTTGQQIQAIAQQCGVPDVNYFARICRKYLGCSPAEYRRHGG